jgi:hypothetical protein
MSCAPRFHRRYPNLLCTPGFGAVQAVAPCSLCAAVATVANGIAATDAGSQLGGSSDAPPALVISRPKRQTWPPRSPALVSTAALSATREASRSSVDHYAGHLQALRAAQMLRLRLPVPLD